LLLATKLKGGFRQLSVVILSQHHDPTWRCPVRHNIAPGSRRLHADVWTPHGTLTRKIISAPSHIEQPSL
jgi:hypothetical protein